MSDGMIPGEDTTPLFMAHRALCPQCGNEDDLQPLCVGGFRLLQQDLKNLQEKPQAVASIRGLTQDASELVQKLTKLLDDYKRAGGITIHGSLFGTKNALEVFIPFPEE